MASVRVTVFAQVEGEWQAALVPWPAGQTVDELRATVVDIFKIPCAPRALKAGLYTTADDGTGSYEENTAVSFVDLFSRDREWFDKNSGGAFLGFSPLTVNKKTPTKRKRVIRSESPPRTPSEGSSPVFSEQLDVVLRRPEVTETPPPPPPPTYQRAQSIYEILTERGQPWCRICGTISSDFWRKSALWGENTVCFSCVRKAWVLKRVYDSNHTGLYPYVQDTCAECRSDYEEENNKLIYCDGCARSYHQRCRSIPDEVTAMTSNWFCSDACKIAHARASNSIVAVLNS